PSYASSRSGTSERRRLVPKFRGRRGPRRIYGPMRADGAQLLPAAAAFVVDFTRQPPLGWGPAGRLTAPCPLVGILQLDEAGPAPPPLPAQACGALGISCGASVGG